MKLAPDDSSNTTTTAPDAMQVETTEITPTSIPSSSIASAAISSQLTSGQGWVAHELANYRTLVTFDAPTRASSIWLKQVELKEITADMFFEASNTAFAQQKTAELIRLSLSAIEYETDGHTVTASLSSGNRRATSSSLNEVIKASPVRQVLALSEVAAFFLGFDS
jgi:hypothetical protein